MKKFVAFVMILSLGLFCAIGCQAKKVEKKPEGKPAAGKEVKPEAGKTAAPEAGKGAEAAKPAAEEKKADEKAPEAAKPAAEEKKADEKAPEAAKPAEEKKDK